MKRVFAAVVAVFLLSGALSASAAASQGPKPVVFETARAIPTKSGEFVRISVYAKQVKKVAIRVNGEGPRRRAERFGTGCGTRRCSKWRIYVPRTMENECYELVILGYKGNEAAVVHHTVCEPFPDGSV